MRRLGIDDAEWLASAEAGRSQGQTVMFVAFDGAPAGLIAVADPIKSISAAAIRALHERGIEVVMLTGDSRATAEAVARRWEERRVGKEWGSTWRSRWARAN